MAYNFKLPTGWFAANAVWLDFDPQIGNEQKGRRPALVISNKTKPARWCAVGQRKDDMEVIAICFT